MRLQVLLAGFASTSHSFGVMTPSQAHFGAVNPSQGRADAVKEAFSFAWDGYYEYAFPNDELRPVNSSYSNSR